MMAHHALCLALAASVSLGTTMEVTPKGGAPNRFAVEWFTIDAGGGRAAGPRFVVDGTLGQFDADALHPATSTPNNRFAMVGGFWGAATIPAQSGEPIFQNGFEGTSVP